MDLERFIFNALAAIHSVFLQRTSPVKFVRPARLEVNIVLQHAPEEWAPTYRFLFAEGDWSQVLLYNGREFRPECDQLFLSTMALTSSNFGFTHVVADIEFQRAC